MYFIEPKLAMWSAICCSLHTSFCFSCSIQNCIVCEDSVVSDGCELKDCLVGSHFTVPVGGKFA